MSPLMIILLVLLVLIVSGGFYGSRAGWDGRHYGGGFSLLLIVLLILYLTGNLRGQSASPDNSRVPPLTSVTDQNGATWSLSGTTILRNGANTTGGSGRILLIWKGIAYVRGTDDKTWFRWSGSSWESVGADPGIVVPDLPIEFTPDQKLAWTMINMLPSAVALGAFQIYVDGVAGPLMMPTCKDNAGSTACIHDIPAMTPGTHKVSLTFTNKDKAESKQSNVLTLTLTASISPSDLQLK